MAPTLLTTTAYFPPLRWFLEAGECWHWEAHENYQKGGLRNRCDLITANKKLRLSVPLSAGKHQRTPIREVRISYRNDWWRAHEQTIRSAYGKAPFYEFYAEEVFAVARRRPPTLWELNWSLTTTLLELLQLPTELSLTSEYVGRARSQVRGVEDELGELLPYPQVFTDRHGFVDDLSILDGLFCLGPELVTRQYNFRRTGPKMDRDGLSGT